MKPTDIIKKGHVAYHVSGGLIDDMMILKPLGGYEGKRCQELIDDGWSFVCNSKKYKIGQKTRCKPWPKTVSVADIKDKGEICPECLKCGITRHCDEVNPSNNWKPSKNKKDFK